MIRRWADAEVDLDDDEPTLQSISQLVAAALALLVISFFVVSQSSAAFDTTGGTPDAAPPDDLPLAEPEAPPTPVAPGDPDPPPPTPTVADSVDGSVDDEPLVITPSDPGSAPTPAPAPARPEARARPTPPPTALPAAPAPVGSQPGPAPIGPIPSPTPLAPRATPTPATPRPPSAVAADLTDDDGGATLFPLSGLTPTRPAVECIRVTYTGDEPLVAVELFVTTTGELASLLDLRIEVGAGGGFRNCEAFTPQRTAFEGPLPSLTSGVRVFDARSPSESAVVRITVALDDQPPRSDAQAVVDFTWGIA